MIELTEFIRHILPEAIGCPDAIIVQAVEQAIIDFADKSWIFKTSFNKALSSSDIITTINDYVDFDVGEYVTDKKPIAIPELRINGEEWLLKYIELYDETNYIEYLRDSNQKIFSFPDSSTVRIHELEASTEVYMQVVYKPIYGITEIDDIIYEDWLDAIASGAKARLLMMPNQPWTNAKMAGYYEAIFRGYLSSAKHKIQKSYTDESGRVQWKKFGE